MINTRKWVDVFCIVWSPFSTFVWTKQFSKRLFHIFSSLICFNHTFQHCLTFACQGRNTDEKRKKKTSDHCIFWIPSRRVTFPEFLSVFQFLPDSSYFLLFFPIPHAARTLTSFFSPSHLPSRFNLPVFFRWTVGEKQIPRLRERDSVCSVLFKIPEKNTVLKLSRWWSSTVHPYKIVICSIHTVDFCARHILGWKTRKTNGIIERSKNKTVRKGENRFTGKLSKNHIKKSNQKVGQETKPKTPARRSFKSEFKHTYTSTL